MWENCNDLCGYLPRFQFEKNTIHHSTIGITPYGALFHHKPSFGLSDLGIPSEIASDIHTEQDLECVIDEINAAAADDSEMMPDDPSDNEYPPHVTSQTFPIIDLPVHSRQTSYSSPPPDSYLEDISMPMPEDTRVFDSISSFCSSQSLFCAVCLKLTSGAIHVQAVRD